MVFFVIQKEDYNAVQYFLFYKEVKMYQILFHNPCIKKVDENFDVMNEFEEKLHLEQFFLIF